MEEQHIGQSKTLGGEKSSIQYVTKTFCRNEKMSCSQCRFCDQDIDTYPCDKCHTRN
jgi:hypothetical protein